MNQAVSKIADRPCRFSHLQKAFSNRSNKKRKQQKLLPGLTASFIQHLTTPSVETAVQIVSQILLLILIIKLSRGKAIALILLPEMQSTGSNEVYIKP